MVICDGCNVRENWEHRCHKEDAFVGGKATGKLCECKFCKWKTFWFDGNQFCAVINSRAKWEEVILAYNYEGGVEFLRTAKENSDGIEHYGMPSFGFRNEHDGPRTLGEWADKNKIDLTL